MNVVGNATFESPPRATPAGRAEVDSSHPEDLLRAAEREFAKNLRELERCYIEPDLQDFNPPDEQHDPGLIVSRQPAFRCLDAFFRREHLPENGNRCLFILGDAGMGKTSLLLMLALRSHGGDFPPGLGCRLLKLGPDTLERIEAIPDPIHTVVLLDSLDEDPAAIVSDRGAEERLAELLPRLIRFHRAVITCRTQFFLPTSRQITTKEGHFVAGSYECPLKYVSLFDNDQVDAYLRRRYDAVGLARVLKAVGLWRKEEPKFERARQAAQAMESLKLRPLLLSHIDDFVDPTAGGSGIDFGNRYGVFHRLVGAWLDRDAQKAAGLTPRESWRVAALLALHFARSGKARMAREEIADVPGLERIPRFKIEARSLLSRTSKLEFQFAHRTIQEFLLAHAVLDLDLDLDVTGIELSREAYGFLADGHRLRRGAPMDLRGARLRFAGAGLEFARGRFGIDLIAIGPGEFLMGSPEGEVGRRGDERQHRVRLTREYWLGRYPVTQGEYRAVMGREPSHLQGDRRPVEQVSWDEAMEFCQRLTALARGEGAMTKDWEFRLPTEAEWEYACRAGTESAFNDGSECTQPTGRDRVLERLGWYDKNSGRTTHPVGEKEPNRWGLYDLHGNVWEWCLDRADLRGGVVTDTYRDGVEDPLCEEGAWRVVRGGSAWDDAWGCRSAYRHAIEPGLRRRNLGFRLAGGQPVGRAGGAGKG